MTRVVMSAERAGVEAVIVLSLRVLLSAALFVVSRSREQREQAIRITKVWLRRETSSPAGVEALRSQLVRAS